MNTKLLLTTSLAAASLLAAQPACAFSFDASSLLGGLSSVGGHSANTVRPRAKLPKGISVDDGKGGWKPYTPPARSNVLGSTNYGGESRTVTDNGGGSHTVTTTDAGGRTTTAVNAKLPQGTYVDDGNGGWKKYAPPAKSNELGSTTDGGETRVVTDNGDGTHTLTVTDKDGNRRSEIHKNGEVKSNVVGYGVDGDITRTVIDNGGGVHTLVIADQGVEVGREVHKHPRPPKPIRHVTVNGWPYFLEQDRDSGDFFIQIEDANGNDVHIDGSIQMPGGGPLLPVR